MTTDYFDYLICTLLILPARTINCTDKLVSFVSHLGKWCSMCNFCSWVGRCLHVFAILMLVIYNINLCASFILFVVLFDFYTLFVDFYYLFLLFEPEVNFYFLKLCIFVTALYNFTVWIIDFCLPILNDTSTSKTDFLWRYLTR